MTSRPWRLLAAVPACVCLAGAAGAAARPDRPDRPGTTSTAARTPAAARPTGGTSPAVAAGTHVTAVIGGAWTADNKPIGQARVRLRDVVTGRIQASAIGDDAGQFRFENIPGGSYVLELVNASGRVEVVGHVFSIAPGETVATFVRTGTRVPWFDGFFNNVISAVAATAASEGVTAIAPVSRPVSPNR